MLNSVYIRRQYPLFSDAPLNMGFLAEAMLLYKNVNLLVDQKALIQLAKQGGVSEIMELINEGLLKVEYVEKVIGLDHRGSPPGETYYRPITITVADGTWHLDHVAPTIFSNYASGAGWEDKLAGNSPT